MTGQAIPAPERIDGKHRMRVLVVDVGGTHVKLLASGKKEHRKFDSGPSLTPGAMVDEIERATADWSFDVVSIGYPGPVSRGEVTREPENLAPGWRAFDFPKRFGRPVHLVNDAAMQAIGSYAGGRMLFLGLGTGLGSTMIVDNQVVSMELAHLPYRKGRTYEDYVGKAGMRRMGQSRWREHVAIVIDLLRTALDAEEVVVGGGNARKLRHLGPGVRLGDNAIAVIGGFRLWSGRGAARGADGRGPVTRR